MALGYYNQNGSKTNSPDVKKSKRHEVLPVCCPRARSRPPPLPGGLGETVLNHFRGYLAIHGNLCKDFSSFKKGGQNEI